MEPVGNIAFSTNESESLNDALDQTTSVLVAPRQNAVWPGLDQIDLYSEGGQSMTLFGGETTDYYIPIGGLFELTAKLSTPSTIFYLVDYSTKIVKFSTF